MLSFILAVILLGLALATVVLRKTYSVVPVHELKRQAAGGNAAAKQLYQAVAYGASLRILLWFVLAASSALGFILMAEVAPAWMGFIVVTLTLWLAFSWLPNTRLTGIGLRLTETATPVVVGILHRLDPLLRRFASPLLRRYTPRHSGLYELQDLLDLLDLQAMQEDSRITSEEIALVRQVLRFGDYKVRDVMRPRLQVTSVSAADPIGPVLLDELHAAGQTSFPVKKSPRSKEIVGTLHLGDVGIHSTGTVEDYLTPGVTYIHESDSLADALHIFYQTRRQLFVVINGFEEYVGILTLQDILLELVGRPEANEKLGSHHDRGSVAARHGHSAAVEHTETGETVVE